MSLLRFLPLLLVFSSGCMIAVFTVPENTTVPTLKEAHEAYLNGDYILSRDICLQIAQKDPRNQEAKNCVDEANRNLMDQMGLSRPGF